MFFDVTSQGHICIYILSVKCKIIADLRKDFNVLFLQNMNHRCPVFKFLKLVINLRRTVSQTSPRSYLRITSQSPQSYLTITSQIPHNPHTSRLRLALSLPSGAAHSNIFMNSPRNIPHSIPELIAQALLNYRKRFA